MLEDLRFEKVDPRVDRVAQGFIHLRFFLEGLDSTLVITHDHAVAAHLLLRHAFRDQAGESTLLPVAPNRFG